MKNEKKIPPGVAPAPAEEAKAPKPVITWNPDSQRLHVDGEGWTIDVKVLSSGRQVIIYGSGTVDGSQELIIRPIHASRLAITSRASEKGDCNGNS